MSLVLLSILLLVLSIPLIYLYRNKITNVDLFEPVIFLNISILIFYFFGFIFFILEKKHFLLSYWNTSVTEFEIHFLINYAIVSIIIAVLAFYVGYYIKIGSLLAKKIPEINDIWITKRVLLIVCLFTFISIVCIVLLRFSVAGWEDIFLRRGEAFVGKYYLVMGTLLIIPASYLFFIHAKGRISNLYTYLFISFSIFLLILTGIRTSLLFLLTSLFVIRHYMIRKVRLQWFIVSGSVVLIVLISFTALFREYIFFGHVLADPYQSNTTTVTENIVSRFRALIILPDILILAIDKFPAVIDFQYGKTLIPLFTSFIPHSIFPEKSPGSAVIFTRAINQNSINHVQTIPPSLLGELYMNLAILGIIIGMFFFGIVSRISYQYLKEHRSNKFAILTHAVFITSLIPILRGGLFGPIIMYVFIIFFVVIAVASITNKNTIINRIFV